MRDGGGSPDGDGWPVELRGITESLVATRGPNGVWNVAALGLHAGEPVTAMTWGRTRTRANFERERGGVVQFSQDPVDFVEAALGIREADGPVLDSADAWVEVEVAEAGRGESEDTQWVEWRLEPTDAEVRTTAVPTANRGYNAVIEATVAASRLDVDAYDTDELLDRVDYLRGVARRCGGEREREAFDRLVELADHQGLHAETERGPPRDD